MTRHEVWMELHRGLNGKVQNHQDDLKIDRAMIEAEENQGVPFLHYASRFGTHMMLMPSHDHPSWPKRGEMVSYLFGMADRWHILRQILVMAKHFNDPCQQVSEGRLVHYFDGRKLRLIDEGAAVSKAAEHARSVLNEWDRKNRENA